MRMKIVWAAAGIAAALALVASGCGGGGGKAYKDLTTAEYASILDELCASANKQIENVGGGPDIAGFKEAGPKFVEIGNELVKKIGKVTPPDELKDTAKQFNEANQAVVDLFKKAADAAKKDDQAAFDAAIAELQKKGPESDALATKLGAKGCAS